jgi:hypothetical protein
MWVSGQHHTPAVLYPQGKAYNTLKYILEHTFMEKSNFIENFVKMQNTDLQI